MSSSTSPKDPKTCKVILSVEISFYSIKISRVNKRDVGSCFQMRPSHAMHGQFQVCVHRELSKQ